MKWVDAPLWMKICRNVKVCRKWKKDVPEHVAFKANIDLKRYKRIERGVAQDITFDEVYRIAKVLKIERASDIDNIIYY